MERKDGKAYLKELKEARKTMTSLCSHITERLGVLIKNNPYAVIDENDGDITMAEYLNPYYVDLSVDRQIEYIILIEKWINDQSTVKQLTII